MTSIHIQGLRLARAFTAAQKCVAILGAVALLLSASTAMAALTGTISGVVKDTTGQPLPGVSVTVTGTVLQGSRTAMTNAKGAFLFTNMPPGAGYFVTFAVSGFQKVERTNQSVSLDRDTQVNATMQLATVATEVVVTGETPVVDTTQTNTAQNFDDKYLRKLTIGSGGRNYLTVAQQAPGVVGTGNSSIMGGNSQQNSFLIDGINNTDPITHTFGTNLNFDAIQEVSVQTSSFQAEFGRATGGVLNVVTKSGGNEFHGSFDFRYTSNKFSETGDYFDPDIAVSKSQPWGVTLGGPILKDGLWFFVNTYRSDSSATPFTTSTAILAQNPSPTQRTFQGWDSGAKLTFRLSDRLNGFFNFIDSRADIAGADNSVLYRPETSRTQEQPGQIYTLKLSGVFTPTWFGEMQGGRSRTEVNSGPTSGDIATTQWINTGGSNVRYDNASNYQTSVRIRDQVGASSTYYLSGGIGTHEFKAGLDYEKTSAVGVNFTTGTPSDPTFCPTGLTCGATINFNGFDTAGNRRPTTQSVVERLGELERTGNGLAGYIQDRWRPTARLTFNIGLRYDQNEYFNNLGNKVLDYNKFQPRLAGAWDLFGNGKNIVRASYGTFYEDAGLTLARLFYEGSASAISRTYTWNTAQQKWLFTRQTGGVVGAPTQTDGEIKPTYSEQVNLGFEREVIRNGSFSATYVYKKSHDIFEDTCITQAECEDYWLSNQPGRDLGFKDVLTNDYYAYILQFEYRYSRGLVNANYTYSKSRGSIDSSSGQFAGGDFDHFPENFVNRYGYLGDDARNRFKIFGSYRIPWVETDLGVNYSYRSGAPYTVTYTDPGGWGTVFAEPRGESRTPVLHVFDVQLEKTFNIAIGKSTLGLSIIGSVFNILNSEQPTGFNAVTNAPPAAPPASLRTATTYQRPRNYQIGFRVEF
ncbi:MAG: TonB-dependent receptor [Holophagales bacterium]|nr:TonB-dependent receptor [Holophagales bacterium]MBK9963425.1 TonB-dependent receptor [Holophagales bacterium]